MRLLLACVVFVGVVQATTNFTNDVLSAPDVDARYPSKRVYPDYLRDIVDKTETFRIYSNYDFQNYCARLINSKRQLHENTPNLMIGQNFTDYTLDRAYQILADIERNRDINKGRYPYGESFFWFYDPARFRSEEEAVSTWYEESKLYDFNSPKFSPKTGGFTQLVWRASEKMACAKIEYEYKANLQRRTLFVCNFWPAGNVNGEFAYNVMPTSRHGAGQRPPPDDGYRPTLPPPRPPTRPPVRPPVDDYPPARPSRPNRPADDDYPSRPNRPNRPSRPVDDDYPPSRPNRPSRPNDDYPGDRPTRPSRRPNRPRPTTPQPDYDYEEDYEPTRRPSRRPSRRPTYPDYDRDTPAAGSHNKPSHAGSHVDHSDDVARKPKPDWDKTKPDWDKSKPDWDKSKPDWDKSNDLAPKAESSIDTVAQPEESPVVMEPADATATVLEERQRRPPYYPPYYPPHRPHRPQYPPHRPHYPPHRPHYPPRGPYYGPYYAFRSAGELATPGGETYVVETVPNMVTGSSEFGSEPAVPVTGSVHVPTVENGAETSTVELHPQAYAPVAIATVPLSEITASEQAKSFVQTVPVSFESKVEPTK